MGRHGGQKPIDQTGTAVLPVVGADEPPARSRSVLERVADRLTVRLWLLVVPPVAALAFTAVYAVRSADAPAPARPVAVSPSSPAAESPVVSSPAPSPSRRLVTRPRRVVVAPSSPRPSRSPERRKTDGPSPSPIRTPAPPADPPTTATPTPTPTGGTDE